MGFNWKRGAQRALTGLSVSYRKDAEDQKEFQRQQALDNARMMKQKEMYTWKAGQDKVTEQENYDRDQERAGAESDKTKQDRIAQAEEYGMKPGSFEYNNFILTGKMEKDFDTKLTEAQKIAQAQADVQAKTPTAAEKNRDTLATMLEDVPMDKDGKLKPTEKQRVLFAAMGADLTKKTGLQIKPGDMVDLLKIAGEDATAEVADMGEKELKTAKAEFLEATGKNLSDTEIVDMLKKQKTATKMKQFMTYFETGVIPETEGPAAPEAAMAGPLGEDTGMMYGPQGKPIERTPDGAPVTGKRPGEEFKKGWKKFTSWLEKIQAQNVETIGP